MSFSRGIADDRARGVCANARRISVHVSQVIGSRPDAARDGVRDAPNPWVLSVPFVPSVFPVFSRGSWLEAQPRWSRVQNSKSGLCMMGVVSLWPRAAFGLGL